MPTNHISLFESVDPIQILSPRVPVNNTTVTSAEVDMQGYEAVDFYLSLGTIDHTVDMTIESSTTSGGTLVALTDVDGVTAALTQISATGDNAQYCVSIYRPTNRYLKAVVTVGAGTTGAYLSATAIRYRKAGNTPVTSTLAELIKSRIN